MVVILYPQVPVYLLTSVKTARKFIINSWNLCSWRHTNISCINYLILNSNLPIIILLMLCFDKSLALSSKGFMRINLVNYNKSEKLVILFIVTTRIILELFIISESLSFKLNDNDSDKKIRVI